MARLSISVDFITLIIFGDVQIMKLLVLQFSLCAYDIVRH